MIFRSAEKKDVHAVYLMMNQLEDTVLDQDFFMQVFFEQCADERHCMLVCEENDQVIGVCNLVFRYQIHHSGSIAEIEELVVDEKHRGKQIGKTMMEKARIIAKEAGCEKLILSTNIKRKRAHRFYEREGMKMTHFMFEEDL